MSLRVILKVFQNRIEKILFQRLLGLKAASSLLILVCLLSIVFSSSVYSQNSQLQNFNTKEGLPQSQVYDIVQDSIGYLWLATQGGGLARFDGDEFTVFNKKRGLQSNFVNALLVSGDDLYIGTHAGLFLARHRQADDAKAHCWAVRRPKQVKAKLIWSFLAPPKGINAAFVTITPS